VDKDHHDVFDEMLFIIPTSDIFLFASLQRRNKSALTKQCTSKNSVG
jgi:hypothetical protein